MRSDAPLIPYQPAPIPDFEAERLQELYALRVLDTEPEERFARYTRLAADIFDVPIALVTLIDRNRQWFKAACGVALRETPRDVAFCAHAILMPEILVVPDAKNDSRFAGNPFVVNEPHITFYAGAVVRGPTGQPLGTLCLASPQTRVWSERDSSRLCALARMVEGELQHHYRIEELSQQVELAAYYDPLTGLPNSRLVRDRLQQALRGEHQEGRQWAVVVCAIDRFDALTRALGGHAADAVLQEVARRLQASARPAWTVGRGPGDHFVVLAQLSGSRGSRTAAVQSVVSAFHAPFRLGAADYTLTVHVGVSVSPDDGDHPDALLEHATAAMETIRPGRQSSYRFYNSDMTEDRGRDFLLEAALRRAVACNQLHLVYQPLIDLRTGRISGAEALLRWTEPELGPIAPTECIALAEQTGLIMPLGDWVLRTACAQSRAWQAAGMQALPIAVNISSVQLRQPDFPQWVRSVLTETGLEGRYLHLEVTEGMLIEDIEMAIDHMRALNALGVQFAIDDFGTGYSSLSYLCRLPVGVLKLDKSFVDELTGDANEARIAKAVIAIAHGLNLQVVAEGVETPAQLVRLRDYGCDQIQGYYFSRPLPPAQFKTWVTEDRQLHG